MYCTNCGGNLNDTDVFCPKCGTSKNDINVCPACGEKITPGTAFCSNCGAHVPGAKAQNTRTTNAYGVPQRSRLVAGLLGILLGSLGVHSFYLGYTTRGILQILVTIITCGIGAVWGFIEGIMILVKSINVDADGIPLYDDFK
ncbi:MAG: TM2 domain-containing protein [Oscillospiraceae bacterium]